MSDEQKPWKLVISESRNDDDAFEAYLQLPIGSSIVITTPCSFSFEQHKAHAEFIHAAVNAHAPLEAAAREALTEVSFIRSTCNNGGPCVMPTSKADLLIAQLTAALEQKVTT